ncbi:MAG TPA: FAD-dependent oxidoreductase [Burkholderiaceae bacterium]|jgi:2-polyprenyl-6-methoxyphenol hydroxylase-like FAD-dependent oxidoreductase
MKSIDTEVLVVGAGPVGLALAGDLGWRGRRCEVLERSDGAIYQPKMDGVGVRTMEFCRRWGIVADVEASPYVRSYPQDNVYLTSLNGFELGREPFASAQDEKPSKFSPQKRERCPQNMFDPILQRFAASWPTVNVNYGHKLLSFTQHGDGVEALVERLSDGERLACRARYIVGCDGARSGVRDALGIQAGGRGVLTHPTNVIFECAGLNALHDKPPGYRYIFVGPEGTWATLVAINGAERWRFSILGDASARELSHDDIRALAARAMGKPFEFKILSVVAWQRQELIASHYRDARGFIAGDAAHVMSPTGGFGMNTGLQDAVDLSWKLSAVLEGWGGEGLLESYGVERRPVGERNVLEASGNLARMLSPGANPELLGDSPAAAQTRERVGAALAQAMKREWFSANIHLGYRYLNSPICVYTDPEDPARQRAEWNDATHYTPSTRVGCRAPHAWLADGRSTLDLFGRGYVVVAAPGSTAELAPLVQAAARLGVPLTIESPDGAAVREAYERRFVLVRPDGHVAWRSDSAPADAGALITTVAGRH